MARWRVKHICRYPGCQISTYDTYCDLHPKGPPRRENRPSSANRGYDSRWRKERAVFLSLHPMCIECEKQGIDTPAEIVDHIKPHRGNYELFWDIENWQSLCVLHHNQKTGQEKKQDRIETFDYFIDYFICPKCKCDSVPEESEFCPNCNNKIEWK